jgi:hypothetical protein
MDENLRKSFKKKYRYVVMYRWSVTGLPMAIDRAPNGYKVSRSVIIKELKAPAALKWSCARFSGEGKRQEA